MSWIVVAIIAGALLEGGVVLLYCRYLQEIATARVRVSSGSRVIETASGAIEYAVAGKGPPVLIVHGTGGGFDQALDFGRLLIDGGFQVIAPSRFGYLRTPLPKDPSPAAQADAHASLLDALKLQRVVILGGSAGAPSAMQFALRHSDRCEAMVLLVPLAFAPLAEDKKEGGPSIWKEWTIKTMLKSDFFFWATMKVARNAMIKTLLATPLSDFNNASLDEQERALQLLQHILPIRQREKGLWNDAKIAATLPRYPLEECAVPTLIISMENDLFGTYRSGRYTAEHLPAARFVGYPTGGHLGLGRQKEIWSEITSFLAEKSLTRAVPQS